jgi:hypothetical protein
MSLCSASMSSRPETVAVAASGLALSSEGGLRLGLTGPARSGKDTFGAFLIEAGFRRVAFGDTLKDIAEDMNPLLEHAVDGMLTVSEYNHLLVKHGGREGIKDAVPESRQYLVDLGNSLRQRIPGVEIAATFGSAAASELVVNTNVYHPEEIDAIRAMDGGFVIRVVRPGWKPANPDEARTVKHPVDLTVVNDGSMDDLRDKAWDLLRDLGLLRYGATG